VNLNSSSNIASLSQTKTFYKHNSNLPNNIKPSSGISTVNSIAQMNDVSGIINKKNVNNPINLI